METMTRVLVWVLGVIYALVVSVAVVCTGLLMAVIYYPIKWMMPAGRHEHTSWETDAD